MMRIVFSIFMGTLLLSALAEARSCQDEPERCPVLRWSCVEPALTHAENFVYLSATITNSIFNGDSLVVNEHFCTGRPANCREQKSVGRWTLYPATPQGLLKNQQNGQQVIVNCKYYNRSEL